MRKLVYITFVIGVLLQIYFYFQMPDEVVIRYGMDGMPNGWASRGWLMWYGIGMYLVLDGVFLLCGKLYGGDKVEKLKVPNLAYWQDPSRKSIVQQKVMRWYEEMSFISNCFLIIMFSLNYVCNMKESVSINIVLFFALLAGYAVILFGSNYAFYKQFKNPQ